MPDLKDLKALIRDHQEKDAGLTLDAELCLQTWLVEELNELKSTRQDMLNLRKGSMAEGDDDTPLDESIAEKEAEMAKLRESAPRTYRIEREDE